MMTTIIFRSFEGETIAQFMHPNQDEYWGGIDIDPSPNSILWEAFMQHHYYETLAGMIRSIRVLVTNSKSFQYYTMHNKGMSIVLKPEMRVAELAAILECKEAEIRAHFDSTIYVS